MDAGRDGTNRWIAGASFFFCWSPGAGRAGTRDGLVATGSNESLGSGQSGMRLFIEARVMASRPPILLPRPRGLQPRVFTLATPVVRTSGLQVESELGAAQAAAAAAESRAVELERALQHVAREKDAMAVARDDAVAQYNQLRQSTIQLVNFKNVRPGGRLSNVSHHTPPPSYLSCCLCNALSIAPCFWLVDTPLPLPSCAVLVLSPVDFDHGWISAVGPRDSRGVCFGGTATGRWRIACWYAGHQMLLP